MKKTISYLLILGLISINVNVKAQGRRTIFGTIQDSTGRGLPGISIMVKGTKNGGISDGQGNYQISVPSSGKILEFSAIGFKKKKCQ